MATTSLEEAEDDRTIDPEPEEEPEEEPEKDKDPSGDPDKPEKPKRDTSSLSAGIKALGMLGGIVALFLAVGGVLLGLAPLVLAAVAVGLTGAGLYVGSEFVDGAFNNDFDKAIADQNKRKRARKIQARRFLGS
mgnify:CR=1 FL=1